MNEKNYLKEGRENLQQFYLKKMKKIKDLNPEEKRVRKPDFKLLPVSKDILFILDQM